MVTSLKVNIEVGIALLNQIKIHIDKIGQLTCSFTLHYVFYQSQNADSQNKSFKIY